MIQSLANIFMKGLLMKLGTDFWFWVRLIIEILKAILGFESPKSNLNPSAGHRAFNAAMGVLISENEDDKKTAADLNT